MEITAPVTLTGVDIVGCPTLESSNIIIRRSRITANASCGGNALTISQPQDGGALITGILLEDVEVDGANQVTYGVSGSGYTLLRSYVHGASSDIFVIDDAPTVIGFNAILAPESGTSTTGVHTMGSSHIVVRGNAILTGTSSESAVYMSNQWAPLDDVLFFGNLIDGGGWALRGGADVAPTPTQNRFVGNCWGRTASYGPVTSYDGTGSGNTWIDNAFVDNDAPITP
jgi:hypothetical protein